MSEIIALGARKIAGLPTAYAVVAVTEKQLKRSNLLD